VDKDRESGRSQPGALVLATFHGEIETVHALICEGHDINERWDDDGMTPLMCAADRGYNGVAGFLIDCGADIDARDNDGNTALDYARFQGNKELVSLLMENGATPRSGRSPIEKEGDDYYAAREALSNRFLDDRMFVFEVSFARRGSSLSLKYQEGWSVITRRNVRGYPPVRTDDFGSRQEAIDYLKKVAPTTPRVSLGGTSPSPTPSWGKYQRWLASIGLDRLPYE
jgi:ankyrin repeat protein